jgi:hypothetical protein
MPAAASSRRRLRAEPVDVVRDDERNVRKVRDDERRDDDRLIEAIDSLRTDLMRLPTRPTINWALFNLPEKRSEAD